MAGLNHSRAIHLPHFCQETHEIVCEIFGVQQKPVRIVFPTQTEKLNDITLVLYHPLPCNSLDIFHAAFLHHVDIHLFDLRT